MKQRFNETTKKLILIAMATIMALSATAAFAAKSKTTEKKEKTVQHSKRKAGQPELDTNFSFSGSGVKGQYQTPGEATAMVENEKPLEELLGLRTQFRDRMKEDTERK